MICVVSKNKIFRDDLERALNKHKVSVRKLSLKSAVNIDGLYEPDVTGVIVDCDIGVMPQFALLDMLETLGKRIPVIVLGNEDTSSSAPERLRNTESITWVFNPSTEDVISILDACGAVGLQSRKLDRNVIPNYSAQVPLHMLQNNGALSVIVINANSFQKIAIEYGAEAYHQVQRAFYQILYDLWGQPGCFRNSDILNRKSPNSNVYYIFLEQSRAQSAVPLPSILEKLSERLSVRIQNAFWNEMFKRKEERVLPGCLNVAPEISVGFNTTLYNPCVDVEETVERLLDNAFSESKSQMYRLRNRHVELMHTLIQTPGLLKPNYQAVFQLQNLTKDLVDLVNSTNSIVPLRGEIFGFESLIRVNQAKMNNALSDLGLEIIDSRYLRPDVLFALANNTKLSLELDQACLHLAALNSTDLQGHLMCNILPRNLYHIEQLKHLIMDREEIIFEVSETEAINNFDLMLEVRAKMERMNMGIASDDFGKGYAGLEQIIRIKPDVIKLDRTLIQDIHEDKPKQAFVKGLVEASRISKALMLAEGVEKWEEAEVLQAMGIELIQGFLLHRPQESKLIVEDLLQETKILDTVA